MADYLDKLQDVLDSVDLVREYRDRPSTKEYVNNNFVYKNRKYVFYNFVLLKQFAPEFIPVYNKIFGGKPLGQKRFWNQDDIRVQIEQFITYCYSSRDVLNRIEDEAIHYYTRDLNLSASDQAYLRQHRNNPDLISGFLKGKKKDKDNSKNKPITTEELNKELAKYKEETGKEVKFTEKEHRPPEDEILFTESTLPLSADEQIQKLNELREASLGPQSNGLVDAQGRPLSSAQFDDLGQITPPQASPVPTDLEIIQASPDSTTTRQANMPISRIRTGAQNLASQGRQVLTSNVVQEVGLSTELGVHRVEQKASNFALRSVGNLGRKSGLLRKGGAALRGARGLAGAAKKVGMLARLIPALGPVGIAILGVLILIITIPILMQLMKSNALCLPDGCPGTTGGASLAPAQTMIIIKEGPLEVPNDSTITYNLTLTYKGLGTADIDLIDAIPTGTKFSSATQTEHFDRLAENTPNESIVWHLLGIKSNESFKVSFTVSTQKQDFWAINQATAGITKLSGQNGQGLLCTADMDSRLVPFFEQSAIAANLPPALMYAIAKGEHHGAPITAISLDNQKPLISPCGAHGIMQIQHPNDSRGVNYGPTCQAIGGTANPPESWDPLVTDYNRLTGGKLNNVDSDEDNIWGSSFFVRYFKINNLSFKGKGSLDQYSDTEIVAVSIAYLGELNQAYANYYLNAYHQAIAAQGSCGSK